MARRCSTLCLPTSKDDYLRVVDSPAAFGVPFGASARVLGRGPMCWYRREIRLGRNSIVGTTLRRAESPEHVPADEHHRTRNGEKNYIATAVGNGCGSGAALARAAGADDLQRAYGVFKTEAQDRRKDYPPTAVSTDGGASTRRAWLNLLSRVVILRCVLRGWLAIRSRGKRSDGLEARSEEVWNAYHAADRRSSAQQLRRLREWSREHVSTAWVLEQVTELCGRARGYGEAYRHSGGHRTSSMRDRVMRGMNRYLDDGQHLHGSEGAVERHCRAWALLPNCRPWDPATARANNGWRGPAERVNKHRYHDNGLHNLLVAASFAGFAHERPSP